MSDSRSRSLRLWQLDARCQDWASEALLCVSCGEEVTRDRARIDIAGAHRHAISSTRSASTTPSRLFPGRGCRVAAKRHLGFLKQTDALHLVRRVRVGDRALCQRCGIHLGWQFVSAGAGIGSSG